MKIWQDSIIVVQLGNRAKIFVQNIGFLSGIICLNATDYGKYFSGRKRKQPKKNLKHKETNLIT
jgi:hypothetical protein